MVFVAAALVATGMIHRLEQYRLQRERAVVSRYASEHAQAIQVHIERALSANYALAALVRQGGGTVANFNAVVDQLLPYYPGVSHLVLTSQGVIRNIAPLAGNEKAIGLDVLAYPPQQKEALLSRNSGKLTLAGPLDLVQGGLGLVGRLPIFLDDADGNAVFVGFSEVVLRVPEGLAPAGLAHLREGGFRYELWRIHPDDGHRQTIASSSNGRPLEPVDLTVTVPNGTWILSVAPMAGWGNTPGLIAQAIMAGLFSALLAYAAKLLAELRLHKRGLELQIADHTSTISAAKNQLEATLNAIPDLLWLKDIEGVYLNCNAQFERLYGASRADIIGRTDYDFVEPELADFFRDNDRRAMEVDQPRANEEYLTFAADGYEGLFETVKTPMRDAAGKLIGVLGIARDITARKRDEEALRESETRLNVTLESTAIGIWEWDVSANTWHASPAYFTMLGYGPDTSATDSNAWLESVHPDDRMEVAAKVEQILGGKDIPYHYEARMRCADGSYRWVSVRGKVVESDEHGAPVRMLGVRIDINERKAAEERIHWLAHFDLLTGLPNRSLLKARINHAIARAEYEHATLALIFIDLDHFKNINDTLGHRIGDELLTEAAKRMLAVVGKDDMVARQGGDEFLVVLPGATVNSAAQVAAQLIEVVAQSYHIEQYELVVTASIGISLYPQDGTDFDALFKCADIAMYRAKRDGRNSYRFFTAEMQARSARILQLENALRRALERNELQLHYQPQIALESNRIIGVEALLRWQHPELGMISPVEFIPIAEDSGQILAIGEWVLRTAAAQMKRWIDGGMQPMVVAVNLSAVQFRHPHLTSLVAQILDEVQLPPQYLELELTEGVAMDDPISAIAVMDSLHEHGVRMSIDDFGTGYSSLSYLKRFQVCKLKIDQSFMRHIGEDLEDRAIVKAIISLAGSLGMQTIAEGVETDAQLAFLRDHGCNQVQGYWFSRPLTAERLLEFVREWN